MLTKTSLIDQLDDVTAKSETLESKVSTLTDALDSVQYVLACLCRAKCIEPTDFGHTAIDVVNKSIDSEFISALIAEHGEDGLIELMA
ncbi:MAG: hypothetical protein KME47_09610 [Nodosilinea sp. WJT8-NPBG4]|jgi:hypothetical protein|nr:hypothetical protein [Nodosilinea sp. WJT8-NPBG4]